MGNDIYTMWPVAHTWIVSSLSNPDASPFMSEGEYFPTPLLFVFLWRENLYLPVCSGSNLNFVQIRWLLLLGDSISFSDPGHSDWKGGWRKLIGGAWGDKTWIKVVLKTSFFPLNQIFICLIRSEQTSATVTNFISMCLLICQFSRSTQSNLTFFGPNDVKAGWGGAGGGTKEKNHV